MNRTSTHSKQFINKNEINLFQKIKMELSDIEHRLAEIVIRRLAVKY